MGHSDIPRIFDWVTARKKCTVRELFDLLRKTVESDVIIANKGRSSQLFKFTPICLMEFAVVLNHDSGIGTIRGVIFKLKASKITVVDSTPPHKESLSVRAYLLDGGDCTFAVDEKPLQPWQVSRLALEDVIFDD